MKLKELRALLEAEAGKDGREQRSALGSGQTENFKSKDMKRPSESFGAAKHRKDIPALRAASDVEAVKSPLSLGDQAQEKLQNLKRKMGKLVRPLELYKQELSYQMGVRAAAMRSAGEGSPAWQSHLQWLAACPEYRAAVERGPSALSGLKVKHFEIEGMRLVVPDDAWIGYHMAKAQQAHSSWLVRMNVLQTRAAGVVGDVMLDIGAHVGLTTIPRLLLGHFRRAYLAEPEPTNFACLTHNILANGLAGLALPAQVALSSFDGDSILKEDKASSGGHSLIDQGQLLTRSPGKHTCTVRCHTLETWGMRAGIPWDRVGFIKLDVEHAERYILRAAENILRRKHIVWQLEVDAFWLEEVTELLQVVQTHFTHFINIDAPGAETTQPRPISEMAAFFEDLRRPGVSHYADPLLCNL